jgi:hypothetical protein
MSLDADSSDVTAEPARTHRMSERTLVGYKRRQIALGAVFTALVLAGWFAIVLSSHLDLGPAIGIGVAVVATIWLVGGIQTAFLYRMIKGTTITVSATAIERRGGRHAELLPYSDMSGVEIGSFASGEVIYVRLRRGVLRDVTLSGFEDLESVASRVEAAIGDPGRIRRKRLRIDLRNPLAFVLAMAVQIGLLALAGQVIMTVLDEGGRERMGGAVMVFLPLAVAGYSLSTRPLSRAQGERFTWVDVMLGVTFLLIAVANMFRA